MKAKTTAKRLEKIFGSKVKKRSGSCAPVSGSARSLAIRIADILFTGGGTKQKMKRLVQETESGVLGGGWGYWPAVDRIEEVLKAPNDRGDRSEAT